MGGTARVARALRTAACWCAGRVVIIGMCLVGATIFTTLDLSAWRPETLPAILFKLFGVSLAILAFVLIGRPWAVRRAWGLAILTISIAYSSPWPIGS